MTKNSDDDDLDRHLNNLEMHDHPSATGNTLSFLQNSRKRGKDANGGGASIRGQRGACGRVYTTVTILLRECIKRQSPGGGVFGVAERGGIRLRSLQTISQAKHQQIGIKPSQQGPQPLRGWGGGVLDFCMRAVVAPAARQTPTGTSSFFYPDAFLPR